MARLRSISQYTKPRQTPGAKDVVEQYSRDKPVAALLDLPDHRGILG
jgi:hypothetical protein